MTNQTVITAIRDLVWASIEDRLEERIEEIVSQQLEDIVSDHVDRKFDEDINDRVEAEVSNVLDETLTSQLQFHANDGVFDDRIDKIINETLFTRFDALVWSSIRKIVSNVSDDLNN